MDPFTRLEEMLYMKRMKTPLIIKTWDHLSKRELFHHMKKRYFKIILIGSEINQSVNLLFLIGQS